MTERVFLSKKRVLLKTPLIGTTSDDIAFSLSERLKRPFIVSNGRGTQKTEVAEIGHSVTSYGAMQLEDGSRGYILSVSARGTSLVGIYFYREGCNYLTEMVDPDRRKVHLVVSGEKV